MECPRVGMTKDTVIAKVSFFWYSVFIMGRKNTLQRGSVRYIVFKENDAWYAVGLEFNIVESGNTPQEAMLLLFEALAGYVESARKIKARPDILNQAADKEYESLWKDLNSPKPIPPSVFSFGSHAFSPAL